MGGKYVLREARDKTIKTEKWVEGGEDRTRGDLSRIHKWKAQVSGKKVGKEVSSGARPEGSSEQ